MMLFEEKEVRIYISEIQESLKGQIANFADTEILHCNFEEWADYFESKYSRQIIQIYDNNIKRTIRETKVKKYNQWSNNRLFDPEYYLVDGYEITFTIPFDGYPEFWLLLPSTRLLTDFPAESINKPNDDTCGYLILSSSYATDDLKSHEADVSDFVENNFNIMFGNYKKMIGFVNTEIEVFNKQIRKLSLQLLEARKEKANAYASLSNALNIPMKLNPNAPNMSPVPLQRITKKPASKPISKSQTQDYSVSDADYKNILNIVHHSCAAMESTAKTHNKFGEEELRDNILAILNSHYANMTTGETFRKNGKTDIHIIFENKAAFIGECKIWHGIKMFQESVEQLFGYSTWRDLKTAIIIFNKSNKDFNAVHTNVQSWIKENSICHEKFNDSIYKCTLHREEQNVDMEVAIAIYDLSV